MRPCSTLDPVPGVGLQNAGIDAICVGAPAGLVEGGSRFAAGAVDPGISTAAGTEYVVTGEFERTFRRGSAAPCLHGLGDMTGQGNC